MDYDIIFRVISMNTYYKKGREIVKKLLDNGYQAFFVGGFVRDRLLGIEVNDIDITTNALPKAVQQLFQKTKATGVRYGTVTVFEDNHAYEVTTFRSDGQYSDHRKPDRVIFSDELSEDLKRRDFTINAFAMDYDERIIDLFSGREDLENHLIKAIGDPDQRFDEDALRILRAFRFVSKLGFQIEEKTFDSIQKNMHHLTAIANERILSELKKIFGNPYADQAVNLLHMSGFHKAFPELEKGIDFLKDITGYQLDYLEFFALCFYLSDQSIPDDWRFSNKERAIINKIIELVTVTEEDTYNEMIIYRLGKDIPLMAAHVSRLLREDNDQSQLIMDIYQKLPIRKTCDLKFKGQDILELTSLRNAEIIGEVIDDITYQVITGQLPNEYIPLKKYTLNLLEKKYGERQ